ncbi:universal stress protein A [Nitrosovibrio tenuis]|uniref:Universal stress protein A n=2 Tax=Nitrosovibrio tenuis TaxID=1233 RepID=A0A1H7PZE4_9PROT|nr:universal stress protein A [Nitrosovibrio tenuis]
MKISELTDPLTDPGTSLHHPARYLRQPLNHHETKMTYNYRQILLAADLSDERDHVPRQAKHLAQTFHADLSVIHVLDNIPMPDTAYGTAVPLNQDSSYEMLETVKSRLKQLGDELGIDPSHRWMVWGVPGEEIVRLAEQERIDLIIVGSHARHGLGLLLGSTASSVLHHAKCDVLAIRLPDEVAREQPWGQPSSQRI